MKIGKMPAHLAEYKVAASVVTHLDWVLEHARKRYDFEIAFIVRFVEQHAVVDNLSVAASAADLGLVTGVRMPLIESYGQKVAEGLAPRYVADGRDDPFLKALPIMAFYPIASYVATPILSAENGLLGVMFCASRAPRPRHLDVPLVAFEQYSRYAALDLDMLLRYERVNQDISALVLRVLEGRQFSQYFQPVVDFAVPEVKYHEGLTRLDSSLRLDVPQFLALAMQVSLLPQVEIAFADAIKQAAIGLDPEAKVGINISEHTLLSDEFLRFLARYDHRNTIIELTEHSPIEHPDILRDRVAQGRRHGMSFALDDTGTGFSAIRNILVLEPEVLKVDKVLVDDLEDNVAAQRLLTVLERFCVDSGSCMVVEGVERASQFACLRDLGVTCVQGYYFGKPAKLRFQDVNQEALLRKA